MGSSPSEVPKEDEKTRIIKANNYGHHNSRHKNELIKQKLPIEDADKLLIAQVMKNHCLFTIFTEKERLECLDYFSKWEYRCGMYIYRQHDMPEYLYIIGAGSASVEIDCSVVKSFGERQYFGQDTLCFDSPRSQSIRVITERIIVYSISKVKLTPIIKRTMNSYKEDINSIFNRIHFFNYLTNKERRFLVQNTSLFRFRKRQVLFQKEQDANSFYIVRKGTVVIEIEKKKDIIMIEGDYFGQSAFLSLLNNNSKSQRMGKASANEEGLEIYAIGLSPVKICLGYYIRSIIFFNQEKWALYRDQYLNTLPFVDYHYLLQLFNVKEGKKYSILAKKSTKLKYLFIPLEVEINTSRDLKIYGTEFLRKQNEDKALNYDIVLTDTGYYAYALMDEFKQVLSLNKRSTLPSDINIKLLKQPLYMNMTLTLRNISRFSKKMPSSNYSTILIVQDMKFGNEFVVKIYKKELKNRSASEAKLADNQFIRNDKTGMKSLKIINYSNDMLLSAKQKSKPSIHSSVKWVQSQTEQCKSIVRDDLVIRQRDIVSKLSNRFICGYYKSQHDENNFYIFLEYVRGLSLIEVMNEFGILPSGICKFILASIATALEYLHNQNIIYRNLNNSNILIRNNGHLAFVDFSCSKKLAKSMKTSTLIGNPYYMAPEMIENLQYTYSVDLWSMGIILYEMMTGFIPFGYGMSDPMSIYNSILKDELNLARISNKNGANLIKGLLERDLNKRISSPMQIRKYAFISDIEFHWQKFLGEQLEPPYFPQKSSSSYTNVNNFDYFDASTIEDWS